MKLIFTIELLCSKLCNCILWRINSDNDTNIIIWFQKYWSTVNHKLADSPEIVVMSRLITILVLSCKAQWSMKWEINEYSCLNQKSFIFCPRLSKSILQYKYDEIRLSIWFCFHSWDSHYSSSFQKDNSMLFFYIKMLTRVHVDGQFVWLEQCINRNILDVALWLIAKDLFFQLPRVRYTSSYPVAVISGAYFRCNGAYSLQSGLTSQRYFRRKRCKWFINTILERATLTSYECIIVTTRPSCCVRGIIKFYRNPEWTSLCYPQ